MEFPKYTGVASANGKDSTGRRVALRKWASSDISRQDAFRSAQKAVSELAQRISMMDINHAKHYYSAFAREELVKKISETSAITRNYYGSNVLNTENIMFVDIDLPKLKLFGIFSDPEKKHIARLKKWLADHPRAAVRIYRTKAGLRYLFTHDLLGVNPETLGWQNELGADKLYMILCKAQKCYRARLTPKPWRIGYRRPPQPEQFKNPDDHLNAYQQWLAGYEEKSRNYSVCHFVETAGVDYINSSLKQIVAEHDAASGVEQKLPLA